MDTAELFQRFRCFCGSDRFRKFLLVTNTRAVYKRRLLHWQQQQWEEFCSAYPEYIGLAFDELLDAFRVCHIHDQRLQDDVVQAIYGYWHFPQDYLTALEELFPFANMMYCGDSVEHQRHKNREVKYCSACREALLKWNAGREHKCGIP